VLTCELLTGSVWAAGESVKELPGGPVLSTTVSKTSIHVGDVFEYRITVHHASSVGFVTQDLERTLLVRPFELLDVQTEQRGTGEQRILDVVLKLTSFEKPGRLQIPSFSLFYYPTQAAALPQSSGTQTDVPAQELVVPPHDINLQSTLVGSGDELRDSIALLALPRRELLLPTAAGIVLVLISIWLLFRVIRYLIRLSKSDKAVDAQELRREALQSVQALYERATANGRDPALYVELSKVMRRYFQALYGVNCEALLPDETRDVLYKFVPNRARVEEVQSILESCDEGCFNRSQSSAPDPAALCDQTANLLKSGWRDAK
jgi:hypothetical protein